MVMQLLILKRPVKTNRSSRVGAQTQQPIRRQITNDQHHDIILTDERRQDSSKALDVHSSNRLKRRGKNIQGQELHRRSKNNSIVPINQIDTTMETQVISNLTQTEMTQVDLYKEELSSNSIPNNAWKSVNGQRLQLRRSAVSIDKSTFTSQIKQEKQKMENKSYLLCQLVVYIISYIKSKLIKQQKLKERKNKNALFKALANMNAENEIKQERIQYLWGKVRAYVMGNKFVRRIKTSTELRNMQSLKGITDKRQKLLESLDDDDVEITIYLRDSFLAYLKSYLIIDALSVMPGLFTLETVMIVYVFKLFRYLRIKRYLNFFKLLFKLTSNVFSYNNNHKVIVLKVISIIRIIMIFYFLFHLLSCMWLYIGEIESQNQDGWISDSDLHQTKLSSLYIKSLYYILTSFATVGFGDFSAGLNSDQCLFVICYMMFLQQMFSFFSMQFRSQFAGAEIISNPQQMLDEKKGELELLFMKISKLENTGKFKRNVVKQALLDIELSFKYYFKSIKQDSFYQLLPPRLKQKLMIELYKPYLQKFSYFFEDQERQYYADTQYISKIIRNLNCQIHGPETTFVKPSQHFKYFYFIYSGKIDVYDKNDNLLVQYIAGGFFGEQEIIFKLKSNYNFRVSDQGPAVLLCINEKKLCKILKNYKESLIYLGTVAYERRHYLRELAEQVCPMSSRDSLKATLCFSEILATRADYFKAGELIKVYGQHLTKLRFQTMKQRQQQKQQQAFTDLILEESLEESESSSNQNSVSEPSESQSQFSSKSVKIENIESYRHYDDEFDSISVDEIDYSMIDVQKIQFNKYVNIAQKTLFHMNELVSLAKEKFEQSNLNFKQLDTLSLKFARFNNTIDYTQSIQEHSRQITSQSAFSLFGKLRQNTIQSLQNKAYQTARRQTNIIKLTDHKVLREKFKRLNMRTQEVNQIHGGYAAIDIKDQLSLPKIYKEVRKDQLNFANIKFQTLDNQQIIQGITNRSQQFQELLEETKVEDNPNMLHIDKQEFQSELELSKESSMHILDVNETIKEFIDGS
eukprot:403336404